MPPESFAPDYRSYRRPLTGRFVSLLPLTEAHTDHVVALRNSPHARRVLDEVKPSSPETHLAFYRDYLERRDDLSWVVCFNGRIVGTTALYDITPEHGEKGRLIINETVSKSAPVALEAELLLLDYALKTVQLPAVWTTVHDDNHIMRSLNERLGFRPLGPRDLRGRIYTLYELTLATYAPEKFTALLDYWASRGKKG